MYRRSLGVKMELHSILQDVMRDRITTAAAASARIASSGAADGVGTVAELLTTLNDVRAGKPLSPHAIVAVARLFRDEITLESMPRAQLAVLAKYIGLSPFAPEPVLRYTLSSRLRALKADDADLGREGTATLTSDELRAACEARGMRALDMSDVELRAQLDEWLTLRNVHDVPITLMILSRGFQIASGVTGVTEPTALGSAPAATAVASPSSSVADAGSGPAVTRAIQETLSSLDPHTIQEVVLATAAASDAPAGSRAVAVEVAQMKLDSLEHQNELIEAEALAEAARVASAAAAEAAGERAAAAAAAAADPATAEVDVAARAEAARVAAAAAAAAQRHAALKEAVVFRLRAGSTPAVERRSTAASAVAEAGASTAPDAPLPRVATPRAAEPAPEELNALRALAEGATVARERALLARLRAAQRALDNEEAALALAAAAAAGAGSSTSSAAVVPDGGPSATSPAAGSDAPLALPVVDRGTEILRAQLDTMLGDIDADIAALRRCVRSAGQGGA